MPHEHTRGHRLMSTSGMRPSTGPPSMNKAWPALSSPSKNSAQPGTPPEPSLRSHVHRSESRSRNFVRRSSNALQCSKKWIAPSVPPSQESKGHVGFLSAYLLRVAFRAEVPTYRWSLIESGPQLVRPPRERKTWHPSSVLLDGSQNQLDSGLP